MELYNKIFRIALPSMVGFIGLIFFDIIDIYWIGKIGNRAVAGVASAGFIVWVLYALIQVTGAGCASLVAQFYGANKKRHAQEVVIQSTWLSFAISILVFLILMIKLRAPFVWMGLDSETTEMAISYFRIILCGFPIIYLDILAANIFNAYGDNKTSNIIMLCCLVVNIILDPVLMFGWFSFPEMGVEGAAVATIISHILSLVFRTILLRKKGYIPALKSFLKIRTFYYKKILSIGLPNAMTACVWSIVYPILTRFITPFGIEPLSAIGICHRLESLPYFAAVAFGISMTALVGQATGRRDAVEIQGVVTAGIRIMTFLMTPCAIILIVYPDVLMGYMTSDTQLISLGSEYLFIVGVFELFMGWEMVISGVFTGLGRTYPILWITIPLTVGRIPLAWFLAYYCQWGVSGIWWAISISTLLKGVGLSMLYLSVKNNLKQFFINRKQIASSVTAEIPQ